MQKNIYEYDNREFTSIRSLAQYAGIHEKTLTARLRRGLSLEAACQNGDFRCSYHLDGGEKKSVAQICRDHSKNAFLVKNRLRYGYSLNDALNKHKKVTRQGIPIVVNGVLYNSIAAALKQLGLTSKEATVRRRLREGQLPDTAFNFDDFQR